MTTKPLSLVHSIREPGNRQEGAPPPLLLLLHGLGSHEGDLMPLADYLDQRFFVVSARAPLTLQTGAYAWFSVEFTPNGLLVDAEEAEQSRIRLLGFIDELVSAYPVDARRVYLMGFSQGAIMSLSVALTRPDKTAGIVAMSGRLPTEALPDVAETEKLAGLPILAVHGTFDSVLPIQYGRGIQEQLSRLPVALTYREYPMDHEVTPESLSDIAAWLAERLNNPACDSRSVDTPGSGASG